ncbi:acyl-CoA dehydrogenase family protein [Kineosporia succinea]|uniref:Alkylation response protein AidB-like acyl-CoA dehydrogenase n=1 Tax=Kineosporia succinea TaxID=84632 RepID=A0ABT9P047_9ACTN|nr:hypothetical protein [Kineosporia succinea]MDP9826056.1 alkylation response protein AidB-like acyl-CoA dehydrogenase [Kineosporia succinea]
MTDLKTLAAHAAETEASGRPAAESIAAVRAAGDFALRAPAEQGGAWATASTTASRLADLGRACPSTSWNVGTCAVAKTLLYRAFGVLEEIGPDVPVCGTGAPTGRVEDGRVRGSWVSVSGCEDAEWALLGVMDGSVFSVALIPMSDLEIRRTWDVAGMRGTGSHSVVADGVLVPAGRIAAAPLPGLLSDRLFFALTVLAPVVGAARGALDEVREMFASDRKPYMTAYTRMGESAGAREWLGRATYLVDRASRALAAVASEADSAGLAAEDGTRLGFEMAEASRDCRSALELLLDLGGTRGFSNSSALQRFWRDVAVGGRHPHLNAYLAAERYGEAVVA